MDCRRYRDVLTLLALLIVATAATPLPDEAAYRSIDRLIERGDWPATQVAIDEATKRFGDATSWSWGLRIQRAIALIGQANVQDASMILDVAPPARFGRSEPAVRRRIWRAWALQRRSRPREAADELREATRLAVAYQPKLQTEAAFVAGNIASAEGKPDLAIEYAQQMAKLARRYKQPALEVKASATVALALAKQDRFDEAIAYEKRALPIARSLGLNSLVSKIDATLAWAYSMLGQYDRADEVAAEGYAIAARLNARGDMFQHLLQRGNAHYWRDEYPAAAGFYRQAYALGREINERNAGQAAGNLAAVALASEDYETARQFNTEAFALKRKTSDPEAELHSILIEGRIELGTRRYAAAEPLLLRVVAEAKSTAMRWEGSTQLARLYALTGRTTLADAEFQRALDTVEEARRDVGQEELRLTFGLTVKDFYEQYVGFLIASGRPADGLRVAELSRARTLAEGLGFDTASGTIDPRRVARDRRATVLAYWFAPSHSYLWAINGAEVKLYTLPPASELNGELEAYSRELLGPRPRIGGRGERLFRTLVGPASTQLPPNARVIVIPDGRLNAFNMETLVVSGGRPHYWIEDVTIETAASLGLAARSREPSGKGEPRLLIVGDPVTLDASFPPLPHARAEMSRVTSKFEKTTSLAGTAATPDAYGRTSPSGYAYIHFVAHGTASTRRPLESAVVLSRDDRGYKLYAREILKHPLKARLVTISSCHGAGVRTYAGEGLIGLAWAFLRAGSHQVIAALWEINDSATPDLMDRMYTGIRAGRDPATALRDAKLSLLRSGTVYRHPLYWAPFVLYSGS